MQIKGFYDIGSRGFTSSLRGSASVAVPAIIARESIQVFFRFRETIGGDVREIAPTVNAVRATLGVVDQRPFNGTLKFTVGGNTAPAAFTYNPDTETEGGIAADLQAHLRTITGFSDTVVVERNGSYIATFPSVSGTQQTITVSENRLHPISFVRIRPTLRGGWWEHEIRFVQAPIAFTSSYGLQAGPIPEITALRDGGVTDEISWNEIQRLHVPPGFAGTYRIVKDGSKRSEPLSPRATPAEIAAAMNNLLEPGGVFTVTNPVDNVAYIEFGGDMGGADYPLLTVEVFDGPRPDHVVTLDTDTRVMADILQGADNTVAILEVWVQLEDPEDDEVLNWHAVLRREVGIREAVDYQELAVAPDVDWLRPPTFYSYNPFAPGQVSNGQLHYATTLGNGSASTFIVEHGLDTALVDVILLENTTPAERYVLGEDYTWTQDNDNQITLEWLGDTPDPASLRVVVLGLSQTSFFDDHEHVISDVDGLQEILAEVEERLARLEATSGGTIVSEVDSEPAETARWTLPTVFELFPGNATPGRPEGGKLTGIDPDALTEEGATVIPKRGKALLVAVHDASAEALSATPPVSPGSSYLGRLFQNQTSDPIILPGANGIRSYTLPANGYAGCDGRAWYPVVPYGRYTDTPFTVPDYTEDDTLFSYANDATDEFLEEGTTVQLETSGTLPTGLATGTNYTIYAPNHTVGTFSLKNAAGDIMEVSSAGSGTHNLVVADETSYYPLQFERTLFTIHVNEKQFRPRKDFNLACSFEAAVVRSNVEAQWFFMLELGEARGVSSPGAVGVNLDEIVWRSRPFLSQRIILTPSATTHRFGCRVTRRTVDSVDTLTLQSLLY